MSSSTTSARSAASCDELDQGQRDRVERRRRPVAIALQQAARPACGAIRSRASVMLSGGSASAVSAITSTAVPPWPNSITGPNCRVVGHADDQLIGAGPADHLLHGEAVEPRLRARAARRARSIAARRRAHRVAASSRSSATPPTSRLVGDVGRQDLERHRHADRAAARGRLVRRRGDRVRHDRNAVGREHAPWPRARVSQSRPCASALGDRRARAAATSGANRSGTEGGVSISASWLRR